MKRQFNKLEDILLWKKSKFKVVEPRPRWRVIAPGQRFYEWAVGAWLYYPDEIVLYNGLLIVKCACGSIG